ncbi:hypothetical protein SPRG_20822 [Saprolegnia parasitica CBS 223.65]|uniref:Uncharacterized protein n=1 Tax=Saprolegnia parasitica (strain CBS 223.65) TaxID=695850 RepID=A0A067CDA1_SAPPC|nr:hypothetical protein SPRG_20822 [Saprolegnia parasitica CBS 223.65]KDO24787.1 hypothetical protein SPRG_20822 [Saprolegnia parasitica CBS 223.65]|eukprot:XP_012204524.1 hypothetical protein SPRG_20822 [Saprolegnia parasitica CBS 223.65]
MGSKTDVLKTLRSLIRINRDSTGNKLWSNLLLEKYRARQFETDREKIKHYRSEATDLLVLWSGVAEQKTLWSLDAGIEKRFSSKEIVNKSARLVGLQVPDMYTDKDENKL